MDGDVGRRHLWARGTCLGILVDGAGPARIGAGGGANRLAVSDRESSSGCQSSRKVLSTDDQSPTYLGDVRFCSYGGS